ncbi:MAG: DUF3396 domain-containing protein [Polyangiaceae bacterium]|nr:DUF3396 domain-containing protein [Polyangiaceae bacterium]
MDIQFDENEQELSNILCVKDKDGRVAVMIGLVATVFFDNRRPREIRERVADVAEDYITLVREHLRWTRPPGARRSCRIDSPAMRLPKQWLPDHPDNKSWEFVFHGGDMALAASAFHVSGFGSEDFDNPGLGFLHISFPMLWFAEPSAGTFPEYVLKICQKIQPLSGYAGLGVIESHDGYTADDFQPIVKEIAERFPGLEVESLSAHTLYLHTGIKGVNWLTILGDRWVNEMGGLDSLRAHLDENFGFYPYDGGVVIQAGPKPQIGDAQANRWPKHYVKLAKILKKIQIKNHRPFHFGGPGRMDHEASKAWLFRFDGR